MDRKVQEKIPAIYIIFKILNSAPVHYQRKNHIPQSFSRTLGDSTNISFIFLLFLFCFGLFLRFLGLIKFPLPFLANFNISKFPDIKLLGFGFFDRIIGISSNIFPIFIKNNRGAVLKIIFIFIIPAFEDFFIVPFPLKDFFKGQGVIFGVISTWPVFMEMGVVFQEYVWVGQVLHINSKSFFGFLSIFHGCYGR